MVVASASTDPCSEGRRVALRTGGTVTPARRPLVCLLVALALLAGLGAGLLHAHDGDGGECRLCHGAQDPALGQDHAAAGDAPTVRRHARAPLGGLATYRAAAMALSRRGPPHASL